MYDEFSPNGPITDHEPYMYDDGQAYLGENDIMHNSNICYRLILNSGNYFSTTFKYQNIGNNQGQQGNSFAGPRRHFQKTMALRRKIGEILKKERPA